MVQFDGGKIFREPVHAFEDSAANDGVLLYQFEFFRGEAAGFLQHAVGHAYFADVVQEGADADAFDILRRQLQGSCQSAGNLADAAAVSGSVLIESVEGVGEGERGEIGHAATAFLSCFS